MKLRFGVLSGLFVLGVIGLGLLSAVFTSNSAEAARPVDSFSHTLSENGACDVVTTVDWDTTAFAHKKGYYRMFLWGQNEFGTYLVNLVDNSVDKGTPSVSIQYHWGLQNSGDMYQARVVFYSSRGKDGADRGRQLMLDDQYLDLPLSC